MNDVACFAGFAAVTDSTDILGASYFAVHVHHPDAHGGRSTDGARYFLVDVRPAFDRRNPSDDVPAFIQCGSDALVQCMTTLGVDFEYRALALSRAGAPLYELVPCSVEDAARLSRRRAGASLRASHTSVAEMARRVDELKAQGFTVTDRSPR